MCGKRNVGARITVHEADNRAACDTGDRKSQHGQSGIRRSIRPGAPVPVTLLVADMGDGALLLQGWRAGPSAYLTAEDARPLRQVLGDAFGSEPVADEAAMVGGEVMSTERARP